MSTQTATPVTPVTPVEYVAKYGYGNGPAFKASLIDLCNAALEAIASLREGPFRDTFMNEAGTKLHEILTAFCEVVFRVDVVRPGDLDFKTVDNVFFQRRPFRYRVRGADARLDKASLVTLIACFIAQLRQRCFSLDRARISGSFSVDLLASLEEIAKMFPAQDEKIIFVRSRPQRNDQSNGNHEDGDHEDGDHEDGDQVEINAEDLAGDSTGKVNAEPMHEKKILFEPFVEQIANAFSQAKKIQSIASTASRAAKAQEQKTESSEKKSDRPNQKKKYIQRSEKSSEPSSSGQSSGPSGKGYQRNEKKYQQKTPQVDGDGWTTVKK